jgi:hypothetical protein
VATTAELISIVGKGKLVKLQQEIGPSHFYIPTILNEKHPIAISAGIPEMEMITEAFGGTTIWVGSGYANQVRNGEILQLVIAGINPEHIARRYGITARYVLILTRADTQPVYGVRARQRRSIAQGIAINGLNGEFIGTPHPRRKEQKAVYFGKQEKKH